MAITRRAAELRARGVEVIGLGVGEPDFPSPPQAVEAACRALRDGFTRYTPSSGIPELREAIAELLARRYGAPWQAGDVIITSGAKMALFHLALALFEPGDEVILPTPCWVSFPAQLRFAGAVPVMVPTHGEDAFRIRAEPILERLGERTRAVLINSPANPTGGVIGRADLERVARACAERGIPLIADETYDHYDYEGEFSSAASLAGELGETVVLVGSLSKTFAMTGWRLGYAAGPPALIAALAALQSHSTSNPTSFAMKGAVAALREAHDETARRIASFRARRDLLLERLAAMPGVSCQPPPGAFYAFPDVSGCFKPGREGSLALSEALLDEAGVAVVPGVAFGSDDHLRLSYACSRESLEKGLERMGGVLAT